MIKSRSLVLLLIVLYGLFMVFLTPAQFISRQFLAPILPATIQLQSVSGRIWAGSMDVVVQGELVPITWRMTPQGIGRGMLAFDLQIQHDSSQLTANLMYRPFGSIMLASIAGTIRQDSIEPFLEPMNTYAEGSIEVDNLEASWSPDWSELSADGKLMWSGGTVGLLRSQVTSVATPPLQANLRSIDNGIEARVTDQNNQLLFFASLDKEAQFIFRVFKASVSVLKLPLRQGGGDIVFEMKQSLHDISKE